MVLTDSEVEYIKNKLGREPNSLEYGMLDVMFSEHCSYKSSRPVLSLFPTEGERIILGPGDDAGLVEITEELALAVGIESHNHPSAIEPYGGAGTGIGGILRDIISMGAMPIALLDSIRFGPLEDQKSRYLFENVVKGISDYGNRVGIPTVGGEIEFDDNFQLNPLVNVMCAGIVPKKNVVQAIAPNVGDLFLLMGGRTGRDGIHGVTFASEELTTSSEIEDRPAVQIGDPFTKKMVLEASLEIMAQIPVSGAKDLGGGGLTCCISELAAKGDNGAWVDLKAIPLREEGMTPYEIMLSESQERMMFVINPAYLDKLVEICEKYELPVAVIGEVTDTGMMMVKNDGETIANLPAYLLADPPIVERESQKIDKKEKKIEVEHPAPDEAILKILSSPNIASKKWIYRQYDHEVQIRTMIKPGDDAAVLRVDEDTAVALTVDCNSIHTTLDPYHGGAGSLAEAIRNVVSMGAKPICVVDCLNFGNPEKSHVFWQFSQCVQGMADVARKFKSPVISGNVSFYNETEGVTVNPSPVVGVVGLTNISQVRTMDFKEEGDKIILLGDTYPELDGSEYYRTIHGLVQGSAPKIRIDDELESANTILELLNSDLSSSLTAIHDCSAGGVAIALSEMAIKSGLGAEVDLDKAPSKNTDKFETLFSESHGRYIITVKADQVEDVLERIKVPAAILGEVKGNKLKVKNLVDMDLTKLEKAYYGVIEDFMS